MAAKMLFALILFFPVGALSLIMLIFGGWAIKGWESPLDKLLEWSLEF